jgi:putative membrane protein
VQADLPAGLDKAHQDKLDRLAKLQGKDFTNEYDDIQVAAHKEAVSLFERYATEGDNPGLKDLAASICRI